MTGGARDAGDAGAVRHRAVRIEADGGSRGNPGAAAYGAVLFDADTGEVIAERAETIGVATNNVAEYNGLIAGLELWAEHAPDADLEVRMDSKLVVEQMSGRWKIKHPDMRPLAARATSLAPFGTTYTWIPREKNKHADRILNEALDAAAGKPSRRQAPLRAASSARPVTETVRGPEGDPTAAVTASAQYRGGGGSGTATTLVLVRHGVTAHTVDKRFSGGLSGANPGLSDEGRAQVRATAEWLAPLADQVDVVIASPVRRTRESAEILATRLDSALSTDDDLAEMDFGTWDGLRFTEVRERYAADLDAWLGSTDLAPGGGESFATVRVRVLASLQRIVNEHAGRTVLLVSHVTPIKVLVAEAIGAPLESVYRMELTPASVSVMSFYADGNASLRMFNARPADPPVIG